MKTQFVNKLQEGDTVNDYFVATRKDLRPKQSGGKFLGMVFKDRSGEMGGVMWNNAVEMARLFELGDVVNVRGRVTSYQGNLQIHVEQVLPLRTGEFDPEDLVFTPATAREDGDHIRAMLGTIKNNYLRQLADSFLNDEVFMTCFLAAAAAKKWHHAYRGGLARHVYEMLVIADTMCTLFPSIQRDLLLMGVFLHDVGKLTEMSQDLCVDYTNEGKFLGHIQIGVDMANTRIAKIDGFPESLRLQVLHMIISHHGELENGSPILPKTLEAIVLHHIDNLDAQAAAITRVIDENREKKQDWSDFLQLINRPIWCKYEPC